MTVIEDKVEHSNFYNGLEEVKSESSNFHKYWESYETSNHFKVRYINTHSHQMKVSFLHNSKKVGTLEFREKLT